MTGGQNVLHRPFGKYRTKKFVLSGLIALMVSFIVHPVAAQDSQIPSTVVVNAGGRATLFSPPPEGGKTRAYPLQFAIVAGLDDGTPGGYINFVFTEAFPKVWGAVPPNDAMYLSGKISDISTDAEGFIHLTGTLTEVDFTQGEGVLFLIDDLFDIKVGGNLASNEFILQWCLLPEFLVRVTRGILTVNPNAAPVASLVTIGANASSIQKERSAKCLPMNS